MLIASSLVIIAAINIVNTEFLDLGEPCALPLSEEQGVCITVLSCFHALQSFKRGFRSQPCGFQGTNPLVCCPTVSNNVSVQISKSEEKCNQYKKLLYRPAIGGSPALLSEFPHMVALGFGEKDSIQWLCGGSLISEKFVLTAAHCVSSSIFGLVRWARAGTTNLKEPKEGGLPQDFEIIIRHVHPEFKPPSRYNDIALLELNDTIISAQGVYPACLNTRLVEASKYVQAIDWGVTQFGGSNSNDLIKVDLEVFKDDVCAKSYSKTPKQFLGRGIVSKLQICAGGARNQSNDTCQGDSGGPLHNLIVDGFLKIYNVIGIASFGKGCGLANVPGVYTRVSNYIPWVENIVWPS